MCPGTETEIPDFEASNPGDRGVYGIVTSGPRSPPKSMGAQAQGLGVSPQGHYILTPLQQDDG